MNWHRAATVLARATIVVLAGTVIVDAPHASAAEGDCRAEGDGAKSRFIVGMTCTANETATTATSQVSGDPQSPFIEYRWEIVCSRPREQSAAESMNDCIAARVCPLPRQRLYRLWGRPAVDEAWVPLSARCFGDGPPDAPQPEITPALVLNEVRRIGLPTLQARTQPEGKTLVNFETIFYTEAQPFSATVTLLGQQVEVIAESVRFTWHHGDGTTNETTSPGAPYPSKEIVHRYSDAGGTLHPRVDVTYQARFRVNAGEWQDIDETLTITGQDGDLLVREASPALSGDYS